MTIKGRVYEGEVEVERGCEEEFIKMLKEFEGKANLMNGTIDEILTNLVVKAAYDLVILREYLEMGGFKDEDENNLQGGESTVFLRYRSQGGSKT